MAVGAFWFSIMSVLVKLAGRRMPSMEIAFFRGIITLALAWAVVKRAGISPTLGTHHRLLIQRGVLGAAALACFMLSLPPDCRCPSRYRDNAYLPAFDSEESHLVSKRTSCPLVELPGVLEVAEEVVMEEPKPNCIPGRHGDTSQAQLFPDHVIGKGILDVGPRLSALWCPNVLPYAVESLVPRKVRPTLEGDVTQADAVQRSSELEVVKGRRIGHLDCDTAIGRSLNVTFWYPEANPDCLFIAVNGEVAQIAPRSPALAGNAAKHDGRPDAIVVDKGILDVGEVLVAAIAFNARIKNEIVRHDTLGHDVCAPGAGSSSTTEDAGQWRASKGNCRLTNHDKLRRLLGGI